MSELLPVLPGADPNVPVSAEMVMELEQRVAENVLAVDAIDVLLEWRAQASALEQYLRSRGLQRPMLGAARRVEARIGQLLPPDSYDMRGRPHEDDGTYRTVPRQRHDEFRILSRALSGECDLSEDEWRKSRRALVSLVRNRLGLIPETPPLPDGQYSCIVADPPWRLDTGPDTWGGTGESGHDSLEYEQMSLEDIADLDVQARAAGDAHLYLWTTNRYLRDAYWIAEKWGFRPSVVLTWCKPIRGVGLGDTFRLTSEFVLFCRRGSLDHLQIVPRTWFDWPRGRHSAKPDAFYELVEKTTPGPYLDLFARSHRQGWDVWGDEV